MEIGDIVQILEGSAHGQVGIVSEIFESGRLRIKLDRYSDIIRGQWQVHCPTRNEADSPVMAESVGDSEKSAGGLS